MKKITLLLIALFALFFTASSLQAATVEVGSKDNLRIAPVAGTKETWTPTGVSVSDEALQYGDTWKEMFEKPGIIKINAVVPVMTSDHRKMIGVFKMETRTITDIALVYNKNKKTIEAVTNAGVAKTKWEFSPFIIFAILAIFAMVGSNILRRKLVAPVASVASAAAIAAFAAMVSIVFTPVISVDCVAVVAVFSAFFIAYNSDNKWNCLRKYWKASVIFYVFMIATIVLFYL